MQSMWRYDTFMGTLLKSNLCITPILPGKVQCMLTAQLPQISHSSRDQNCRNLGGFSLSSTVLPLLSTETHVANKAW